jgi:hypothetical protein
MADPEARAAAADAAATSINQGAYAARVDAKARHELRLCVYLSSITCCLSSSIGVIFYFFLLTMWICFLKKIVWGVEQLFHDLEQKYIELKSEFTVCETEKQAIATEKHEASALLLLLLL